MVSDRVKQHLAEFEDRACTCGAGHGSLEGHTDWCDWSEYLSAAARVRAENDAFRDAVVTGLGAVKMNADGSAERVDLRADGRKGCQEGNSNGGQ